MTIEIGQIAAFFAFLAAILKLTDWILLDEQKKKLSNELSNRLRRENSTLVFTAHTPLNVLDIILSSITNRKKTKQGSRKGINYISTLLVLACLVTSGLMTNTILGFEESPTESYRQEIKSLERITSPKATDGDRTLTPEEEEQLQEFRQDIIRILETAKHPFVRWTTLTLIGLLTSFIALFFTKLSIIFAQKTTAAILTTDSPLLLTGALLTNSFVSIVIFTTEIVALSIGSSALLVFLFTFIGILLDAGPFWGFAIFSGYGVLAWITGPIWLKAIATATLVPFFLMVIAVSLSLVTKPLAKPHSRIIKLLLRRSLTHKDGVIAFLATSFLCLAAAITAATNLVN